MKIIPTDVIENHSLFEHDNFITMVDPRHANDSFHYTAWCKKDYRSLLDLTKDDIPMLEDIRNKFSTSMKKKNFKSLLHFPPTFWRLHIHFVELNHQIPHDTPKHEVFDLSDIITNLKQDSDYYRNSVRIMAKI